MALLSGVRTRVAVIPCPSASRTRRRPEELLGLVVVGVGGLDVKLGERHAEGRLEACRGVLVGIRAIADAEVRAHDDLVARGRSLAADPRRQLSG
jgi:hypothetical protein